LPRRIVPDVLSLFEEVRKSTSVELSLEELATVQERLAGRVEVAVEDGEELEGGGGEDLSVATCRREEGSVVREREEAEGRRGGEGSEDKEVRTHPRLWLHGRTGGRVRRVSLMLLPSTMLRLLRETRCCSSLMRVAPAVTALRQLVLEVRRVHRAFSEYRYTFPRYLHLSR
jgi:hypothetical protein